MKNKFFKVSIIELFRCSEEAFKNNEDKAVIDELNKLFINSKSLEAKIPIDSNIAQVITKYNKNITLQNYITLESLSIAFNRLYFGKSNKELLKRIEKYYRKFLENILHDEDNTELKKQIIQDEESFNFIKKYSSYDEYELGLIGKNYKTKILINQNQELKGKAIME